MADFQVLKNYFKSATDGKQYYPHSSCVGYKNPAEEMIAENVVIITR